ncbi:cell division protein FtsL [Haliea sp. E17]|uniref:cell division protein FtsL n=1 Tax=Haliea sp. E17 TaxID=3401576 RepID=UPI003AAFB016
MPTATLGAPAPGRRLLWLNLATLVLVVASAFGVIHTTHACRALYAELQVLEARQWHLQEEYGRLVLEESVWASHQRVEKVARSELHMVEPDLSSYRVVAP